MKNSYLISLIALLFGTLCSHFSFAQGERLYNEHCSTCHKSSGKGLMKIYPPLLNSQWLQNDSTLISVLLFGLKGPIEVNGKRFKGEMPAFDHLSNSEIAIILTYIKKEFGEITDQINPIQVAKYRF